MSVYYFMPVVNVTKRKTWFRTAALIAATCLLLNLPGCVCFQPITKVEPDPTTGKEVVKNEELPLACKIFWVSLGALGALGTAFQALNWFSTEESEKRRKTAEKKDDEYKKAMDALSPKDK